MGTKELTKRVKALRDLPDSGIAAGQEYEVTEEIETQYYIKPPGGLGKWLHKSHFTQPEQLCPDCLFWNVGGKTCGECHWTGGVGGGRSNFEPQLKSKTLVPPPPKSDPVIRPHHYARYKIEPIHFIMENELPFWLGNVIKYSLRYDAKNGVEDLRKASRYLEMQIKRLEGNPDFSK